MANKDRAKKPLKKSAAHTLKEKRQAKKAKKGDKGSQTNFS